MELYNLDSYNKIFLLGEICGDFDRLFRRIRDESITKNDAEVYYSNCNDSNSKKKLKSVRDKLNDSIIIVSGDCGIGYYDDEYYNTIFNKINDHLVSINSHLFFIRGNYDNPFYFNEKRINLSNLKTIPDYSIIKTATENILCVGGAISIDRQWRKSQEEFINKIPENKDKKLYWEEEKPIFNQSLLEEIIKNDINIDFVVTHSAPHFINIKNDDVNEWIEKDENLLKEIEDERLIFTSIYNFLIENNMALKGWFFSHFHMPHLSTSKEFIPFQGLVADIQFNNLYDIIEVNNINTTITRPNRLHDLLNGRRPIDHMINRPNLAENFVNANINNVTEEEDGGMLLDDDIPEDFLDRI